MAKCGPAQLVGLVVWQVELVVAITLGLRFSKWQKLLRSAKEIKSYGCFIPTEWLFREAN